MATSNLNLFDEQVNDDEFRRRLHGSDESTDEDYIHVPTNNKIKKSQTYDPSTLDLGDDEELVNLDGSKVEFSGVKQKNSSSLLRFEEEKKTHRAYPNLKERSISLKTSTSEVSFSTYTTPTQDDVQHLDKQNKKLWQQLENRFKAPPVGETIERITESKEYCLEPYKSFTSKVELLDRALKIHSGNSIIAVTLFLRNTLSQSKFQEVIRLRPLACKHYISYLKTHHDHEAVLKFYSKQQSQKEEAMVAYKLALCQSNVQMRIAQLKTCYSTYFQSNTSLVHEGLLIQEHIALLERQQPIEKSDAEIEATNRIRLFRDHPRTASVIGTSVITTLYYCSLYHYDATENQLACATSIKKQHKLTEKQFFWPVLSARSRLKCWLDIERLLTVKSWFGGTKLKPIVAFDKIVEVLFKAGAHPDVFGKYLLAMDDVEKRLSLSKQYNCHKVIIDTHVQQKNRPALQAFVASLPVGSDDYAHGQKALNT